MAKTVGYGENYFLYIVLETGKGEPYKYWNFPLTIREIDDYTTRFADKNALLDDMFSKTNLPFEKSNVLKLNIRYYPDLSKQKYYNIAGPLYAGDVAAFNTEQTYSEFTRLEEDKEFIRGFVLRYEKSSSPKIRETAASILSAINSGASYSEKLQEFKTRIFKRSDKGKLNYKTMRNTFLAIKKYKQQKEKAAIPLPIEEQISTPLLHTDDLEREYMDRSMGIIPPVTPEEQRISILDYLKEHERHLLDLDSYVRGEESPFDGNGPFIEPQKPVSDDSSYTDRNTMVTDVVLPPHEVIQDRLNNFLEYGDLDGLDPEDFDGYEGNPFDGGRHYR